MSYWERTLREDLTSAAQVRLFETIVQRRVVVEAHRPVPPTWIRSLALEPGFSVTSPVLLSYAHGLIHDPLGVAGSKITYVFSTIPWIERTALKTREDLQHEARRFAMLLDATVRVFLPAIYAAEGQETESKVLQQLPPLVTLRAVLIATKVVVGILEAELKNVAQRLPSAHVMFATVLRTTAEAFVGFDQVVKAAREQRLIPPVVTVELVRRVLTVFTTARRTSAQDTLDDYAVALIGMMAQVDRSVLADLQAAQPS